MQKITAGIGWDVQQPHAEAYDLDVSVFMLGSNGKIPEEGYFVFFNNLISPDQAVIHSGDLLHTQHGGDNETIQVDLIQMNPFIQELVFVVTIYDAIPRKYSFGKIPGAYIRINDQETGHELIRYHLNKDFSDETAMECARLYKRENTWKIQPIGQGYAPGLQGFVDRFHIPN